MMTIFKNTLLKIFFFIISCYNYLLNCFSNRGIKYIAVYKYLDDKCVDVSNFFYMKTLIPKVKLDKGEYEVHYQVDHNEYRQIFKEIIPNEKMRQKLIIKKKEIKSIKVLSAFYKNQDILNLLQQYAGPNADFYGDNNLTLNHLKKQHKIDNIKFMDFNLLEYEIKNLQENISEKFKRD